MRGTVDWSENGMKTIAGLLARSRQETIVLLYRGLKKMIASRLRLRGFSPYFVERLFYVLHNSPVPWPTALFGSLLSYLVVSETERSGCSQRSLMRGFQL